MFRRRLRTLPYIQANWKVTTRIHEPTLHSIRKNSNISYSSSGKNLIRWLIGTGTLVTVTGGTIAYAKYDTEFRKTIEGKIPYSDLAFKYIFEKFFGEKSLQPLKKPSQKNDPSEMGLLQKQIERKSEEQSLQPLASIESTSESSKEIDDLKNSLVMKEKEEMENPDKLASATVSQVKRKNKELDVLLKKTIDELEDVVNEAVSSRKKAAHATRSHAQKFILAIDKSEVMDFLTPYEETTDNINWSDVNSANEVKKKSLNESIQLINSASEKIVKLKNLVENARMNEETAANKNIVSAEDNIQAAIDKLARADKQFLESKLDEETALSYKSNLEYLTNKHQEDLKAVLPNITSKESNDSLTKEEAIRAFIFMCKKNYAVNKALALEKATKLKNIEEAMQKQKDEDDLVRDNAIGIELARQGREMANLQKKKIQEIEEEYDYELRQGLRRQLAAHIEHVQECLQAQEKNLKTEYGEKVDQKVLKERAHHENILSTSFAKLKSIEQFLSARADLDTASRKAKELWLACQALKTTLKIGKLEDINSDMNLKPLKEELLTISKAAGQANPFVLALIDSIPKQALGRGVYTEEALRERFKKVERICRRVAIIDDTGGTLFRYFISYMQSFFILAPSVAAEEIEKDQAIDVSLLGTFEIISRVQVCLQQDNLEQALRYMNLLKGEPRNVAHDWIKELRLLLETRQAADALMAHAAATNVQAYH